MEKKKVLVIVFLIMILLYIFLPDIYYSFSIVETRTYGLDFIIPEDNNIGFNPENDSFHMGTVPIDSSSSRKFYLSHNYYHPVKVDIKGIGNITPYIVLSDNNFILEPNVSKKVVIKLIPKIAPDPQPGNYSGELIMIFRKPLIIW
ncbi:MAG: hypothetical protein JSW73_03050 [Candidatus Woesearchaeota archaeon]|nr:MAG: hypothetical protein JSW73_03050 [Candidatus Woesearchaeota archaeon]